MVVRIKIITMATFAAVAQAVVVSAVTQDTNVLTATIVSATGVHHCRTQHMSHGSKQKVKEFANFDERNK